MKTLNKSILITAVAAFGAISTSQAQLAVPASWKNASPDAVTAKMRATVTQAAQLLEVTSDGTIQLKVGANASSTSFEARQLAVLSVQHTNNLLRSGDFRLTASGQIVPTASGLTWSANQNWARVFWWGYDVGLNTQRVKWAKAVSGQAANIIKNALVAMGYSSPAGYVAAYIKGYATFMNWVDDNGGKKGVQLIANWAHAWVPVCYRQY